MRRPFLIGLGLAVALVALAVALPALRARLHEVGVSPPSAEPVRQGVPSNPSPGLGVSPPPTLSAATPEPVPAVPKAVGKPRLDAQIRKVVESIDRSGQPPAGVAQGGRRGSQRAVFQNLERRLPAKPPGYYRECDVWPRGSGSRGPERLVFGRESEVYYTKDHYKSFVRLR